MVKIYFLPSPPGLSGYYLYNMHPEARQLLHHLETHSITFFTTVVFPDPVPPAIPTISINLYFCTFNS